jgi:hypothetical protein
MVDWQETGLPRGGEQLPPGLPPGITVPVLHDTLPPPLEPAPARAASQAPAPAMPPATPAPVLATSPISLGEGRTSRSARSPTTRSWTRR